jgi:hypothetical protein
VTVSVTRVPLTYASEQSAPQLIPAGLDVTVPDPRPVLETVSMKSGLNVAVTVLFAFIATVHTAPLTVSQPLQPANTEPAAADAANVTVVPLT